MLSLEAPGYLLRAIICYQFITPTSIGKRIEDARLGDSVLMFGGSRRCLRERHCFSAWIRRCTKLWCAGPPMSCAAPTHTSSFSCAVPCFARVACHETSGTCRAAGDRPRPSPLAGRLNLQLRVQESLTQDIRSDCLELRQSLPRSPNAQVCRTSAPRNPAAHSPAADASPTSSQHQGASMSASVMPCLSSQTVYIRR